MKIWLLPIHIVTSNTLRGMIEEVEAKVNTRRDIEAHKLKLTNATLANLVDGIREANRIKFPKKNKVKWCMTR